jgi:hypothetical protein
MAASRPDADLMLVTRFAITRGWKTPGWAQPGWLDDRLRLFERFTLPSVATQTVPFDHWVIGYDPAIPDHVKSRLAELTAGLPVIALEIQRLRNQGDWVDAIDKLAPRGRPLLLSARLDNDDALARTFAARLLDQAQEGRLGFFNFTTGFQLSRGRLYAVLDPANPFIARLESTDGRIESSSAVPHHRVGEFGEVHQIGGRPAWLQVIHGRNLINAVSGSRVRLRRIRRDFVLRPTSIRGESLERRTREWRARFSRPSADPGGGSGTPGR